MKTVALALLVAFAVSAHSSDKTAPQTPPDPVANPNIDMNAHLKLAHEAEKHRSTRRLTEADFIRMSGEKGTVVLDARSKEKFDILHIDGAVNLSFPDIDINSLAKNLPDKDARILIYCNNNFENSPAAFPSKGAFASLNISTYISLYSYGYRNIYELGPRVDPKKSKLPLVPTKK